MTNDIKTSLTIFQSLLLIIALVFVYFVTTSIVSFITIPTLSELIAGILRLVLLIIFIIFMIRANWADKQQFQVKKMSAIILLLGCIMIHLSLFLPYPQISWWNSSINEFKTENLITHVTIFSLIYGCIIAPIFEELFFRGIILGGLLKQYSPAIALVISALMFAIFHANITEATMSGIVLGWIYYKTQNLSYCFIIHSCINLTGWIIALIIKYYNPEILLNDLSQNTSLIIVIKSLSTILFIAGFIILHFIFKRKKDEIY